MERPFYPVPCRVEHQPLRMLFYSLSVHKSVKGKSVIMHFTLKYKVPQTVLYSELLERNIVKSPGITNGPRADMPAFLNSYNGMYPVGVLIASTSLLTRSSIHFTQTRLASMPVM